MIDLSLDTLFETVPILKKSIEIWPSQKKYSGRIVIYFDGEYILKEVNKK
nr:MAG TPA: hypothetical protein [Caudoviricetes sp.]